MTGCCCTCLTESLSESGLQTGESGQQTGVRTQDNRSDSDNAAAVLTLNITSLQMMVSCELSLLSTSIAILFSTYNANTVIIK